MERFGKLAFPRQKVTSPYSGSETGTGGVSSKRSMRKLLCITAHPDDEAGAFGGTLLLYHERGVETVVVCMTAGTAARNRGTARTNEELAELRRAEFAASCKMLGVTHGEVL